MDKEQKKYPCIMADPPWEYRDKGSRINPTFSGHYNTMSLSSIIGLGEQVRNWSDKNCHLWLCTTNSFLLDGSAIQVATNWGFRPVQILTWVKTSIGMGHWLRNITEQILLCVKGRLAPLSRSLPTVVYGPSKRHSEKPEELYKRIEQMSPGPRLELFARRVRDGWDSWGDQSPEESRIHEQIVQAASNG